MDAYTKINDIKINKGVNGSPTTVNLYLVRSTILHKMLLFGLAIGRKYIQIYFEIKKCKHNIIIKSMLLVFQSLHT